ncbi:MAG TPA: MarR family transcriptional regulator [Streptosporangiaceae bacterium]
MPSDPGSETRPEDPLFGYIERFSSVLLTAGFPPMPARVFVALMVAGAGRLSATELAEMLRVSPAAISGAVRYLVQVGIVHKERVPGSRRDYYGMPDNVWHELLRMRDAIMRRWAEMAREGVGLLGAGTPAGKRLAEHAAFLEFASDELPALMERWDKYRAEHG